MIIAALTAEGLDDGGAEADGPKGFKNYTWT